MSNYRSSSTNKESSYKKIEEDSEFNKQAMEAVLDYSCCRVLNKLSSE